MASTKPTRKRTRDPDRAAKILEAARTLFYERGFHAVSVDEIGSAAGATGAAIYRHFDNKEAILAALFDAAQDRYMLGVPDAEQDAIAELHRLIERHTALTLEQRELGSIWAHEYRALSGERARRVDRRTHEYLNHWVSVLSRAFPRRSERAALGGVGSFGNGHLVDHRARAVGSQIARRRSYSARWKPAWTRLPRASGRT